MSLGALSPGRGQFRPTELRAIFNLENLLWLAFIVVNRSQESGLMPGTARVAFVKPERPEESTLARMTTIRSHERDER